MLTVLRMRCPATALYLPLCTYHPAICSRGHFAGVSIQRLGRVGGTGTGCSLACLTTRSLSLFLALRGVHRRNANASDDIKVELSVEPRRASHARVMRGWLASVLSDRLR